LVLFCAAVPPNSRTTLRVTYKVTLTKETILSPILNGRPKTDHEQLQGAEKEENTISPLWLCIGLPHGRSDRQFESHLIRVYILRVCHLRGGYYPFDPTNPA